MHLSQYASHVSSHDSNILAINGGGPTIHKHLKPSEVLIKRVHFNFNFLSSASIKLIQSPRTRVVIKKTIQSGQELSARVPHSKFSSSLQTRIKLYSTPEHTSYEITLFPSSHNDERSDPRSLDTHDNLHEHTSPDLFHYDTIIYFLKYYIPLLSANVLLTVHP